ncbi:PIG-Y family protein [Sporobolomyces salmoneus]|uniref:PIG-Y family protein n=1 Tax=Sporobolomyces salmoneus TaxID=183962 RepID=UPI00316D4AC0
MAQNVRHRSSQKLKATLEGATSRPEEVDEEGEDFEDDGSEMLKWGHILLVGSTLSFAIGIWSILIGPYVEPIGLSVLDALAEDSYYKYLVILLIPVTTCSVIVNWWGLKIFRHA